MVGALGSQLGQAVHSQQPQMRPHAKDFTGVENLARQSFRDECDPNKIVANFRATGLVNHINRRPPQYGEATTMSFHQAACISADIASRTEQGEFDEPEAVEEPETAPEASTEPEEGESSTPENGG